MIIHDVKQGSQEWRDLRAGIPTSSSFHKILTPTRKPSGQQEEYMHSLIAERLQGRPEVGYISWDMARGSREEQRAVKFYEFTCDVKTKPIGFVTTDDGRIGASPDRLVGKNGGLECKVPKDSTHVGYLLLKPASKKYYPQLQGQMWVCEFEWVDILSWHPEMPPALVRVHRDEDYIKLLAGAVRSFSDHLEEQYASLQRQLERGEPQEVIDPLELQREDIDAA